MKIGNLLCFLRCDRSFYDVCNHKVAALQELGFDILSLSKVPERLIPVYVKVPTIISSIKTPSTKGKPLAKRKRSESNWFNCMVIPGNGSYFPTPTVVSENF